MLSSKDQYPNNANRYAEEGTHKTPFTRLPLPLKDECWIEVGASHASYKYDESKQASINNEHNDETKRRPMSMNMNNMMIRPSLVGLRIRLGTGRTSSGWGAAGVSI